MKLFKNNFSLNVLLLITGVLMLGSSFIAGAQSVSNSVNTQHRFWKDVETIGKYDKIYVPQKDPILFVGSSSIRKWTTLQQDFENYVVINRGIGGAVINDLVFYANQLIFKYKPKQIILYIGENDLARATLSADSVFQRFVVLYTLIRSKLPAIPIGYIGLKPSPSRAKYYNKAIAANNLIRAYLSKERNAQFIDVFTPMSKEGKARKELFVGDMLHMNAKGYKIWKELVQSYLLSTKKEVD